MEQIIDEHVALALSKHQSSQAGPTDEMSPSAKGKSSVTSTEAALATTDTAATEAAARACTPPPHYPVDDITERTPCELQVQVANKKIVVAYGVAELPALEDYITGRPLSSAEWYAKIFVDRVVDGWDDLELEIRDLIWNRLLEMPCTVGYFGPRLT